MAFVCCLGSVIPATITGLVYGIVALIPERRRPAVLAKDRLRVAMIILFILVFMFTCAILLYRTKDLYVM